MAKTQWTIGVASDLAVVGYDPEAADLDHPRGERIGEVFYLQATNSHGDRRRLGSFASFDAAEDAIADAPEVILWHKDRPVYGSPAYQQYGQADDMAWEARFRDAELNRLDTRYMHF